MADGFVKVKVIDANKHLMGRLAAVVAKDLLRGQEIVVVRCEGLVISGNFYRNKLKYLDYLRKRMNTNPTRGPFHFRAPSKMFYRVVRGMLPHKLPRGKQALARLKVFEGVPPAYNTKKKVLVPCAYREIRLKPHRRFADVGRLASEVGWKYKDVIDTLEAKRKVANNAYFAAKQEKADRRKKIEDGLSTKLTKQQEVLAKFGYA